MANHRVAVFTLMGAPVCAIGGHGSSPAQFRYPSGVAITSSLLLVSEYIGGRVQVLSPSGAPLQVLHSPFGGAYVCALGADERRVVVTDSRCRLHVFELLKRGSSSFDEPSDDFGLEAIGGGAVTTRRAGEPEWTGDAAEFVMQPSDAPQHVRCPRKSSEQEEKGTRTGGKRARMCDRRKRVEIALEASDLKEVLHALTQDDLHALIPRAYAHANEHPEFYMVPLARTSDELMATHAARACGPYSATSNV